MELSDYSIPMYEIIRPVCADAQMNECVCVCVFACARVFLFKVFFYIQTCVSFFCLLKYKPFVCFPLPIFKFIRVYASFSSSRI